jgi:hypothetical protein
MERGEKQGHRLLQRAQQHSQENQSRSTFHDPKETNLAARQNA